MRGHIAQGVNPLIGSILELGIDGIGISFADESVLSLSIDSFFSRKLVGVFKATFVGYLTFLASVARPLTVALHNRQ